MFVVYRPLLKIVFLSLGVLKYVVCLFHDRCIIHYFTSVFNNMQYVQLVSNGSLSCILYNIMLLPFDV